MRFAGLAIPILLALPPAEGCRSAPRVWPARSDFRAEAPALGPPRCPRTLAVTPPEDRRGPALAAGSHNLAFVPPLPYASSVVYRPEAILAPRYARRLPGQFFDARVAVLDGIVDELSSANIFAAVRPVDPRTQGPGALAAEDLVLAISLLETSAKRTRITYCLSIFGYFGLGLLGAPIERYEERLRIRLRLYEAPTGHELWRHDLVAARAFYHGIYYGRRYDLSDDFAQLFREGLGPALEDLARSAGAFCPRAAAGPVDPPSAGPADAGR